MSNLSLDGLKNGYRYGRHITTSPLLGFKKVNCNHITWKKKRPQIEAIAKIEIPEHSTVVRPKNRKCERTDEFRTRAYININCKEADDELRADKLVVKEFVDMDGIVLSDEWSCFSHYCPNFFYKKNQLHTPDKFDSNIYTTCTNGLHFFLDETAAKKLII